ncbi:MAG: hypothetical protein QXJ96_00030 [Candidatus Aenigmatarchaeota archaeon]|nr:hypothetical protein [Candidatus Aenigmarchaeota archaeon]
MTPQINPWEITLKVYKTGERGREYPVTSYNGEFDVRGVLKGLREENSDLPTDYWVGIKRDFYEGLFRSLEDKVRRVFELDGHSVWDVSVSPLNGMPEYSFGQGSIYITLSPDNSSIKEEVVRHLFSSALTAVLREYVGKARRKCNNKSSRHPVIRIREYTQ